MGALLSAALVSGVLAAGSAGVTLKGSVCDSEGMPVAGARVDVATAAPRVGEALFCPSCYLDCAKSVKTDQAGEFSLADLDGNLTFRLLATAPGKRAVLTESCDPWAGAVKIVLKPQPTDLPVERTVRGLVIDDNGVAIEGALVDPYGWRTQEGRSWGSSDADAAVTDHEGRFAVLLPADYLTVDFDIRADGLAGGLYEQLEPGEREHRIVLPAGTRVTGLLAHDGEAMAGQRVQVVQIKRGVDDFFIKAVERTTDASGRFKFDYLPADQEYVICGPVGGDSGLAITTKKFKAGANGGERDLGTLQLKPTMRLAGRVQAAEGETLPPNTRVTVARELAWDFAAMEIDKDGRFEFRGLAPDTYAVGVRAKDFEMDFRNARYQRIDRLSLGLRMKDSTDDLRLKVRKAAEKVARKTVADEEFVGQLVGLVVDPNGEPVSGVNVSALLSDGRYLRRMGAKGPIASVNTDSEGRFELNFVPPGPIELRVYEEGKSRGAVSQSASYSAKDGEREVRIVFDRSLEQVLEDLDAKRE